MAPVVSTRHRYCESCSAIAAAKRRPSKREKLGLRPNGKARGYDAKHRKLRAKWARSVERGEVVCWRCQRLIAPGSPWDLGHDDLDRSQYRGPEHAKCNRSTAGRVKVRSAPALADWW